MKKILLVVLSLLTVSPAIYAKDKDRDEEVKTVLVKDEATGEYFYEGVVPVEGVTKEEMYKRAKMWVLTNLKTADNNIKFDEDNLTIIDGSTFVIKPVTKTFLIINQGLVNFKINIQFKDEKYKFRFDNLIVYIKQGLVEQTTPYSLKVTKYKNENKYINTEINKTLESLSFGLESTIRNTNAAKDNW